MYTHCSYHSVIDTINNDVVVEVAKPVGKGKRKHVTTTDEAKPTFASHVSIVAPSPSPSSTTPNLPATKKTIPPSSSRILRFQQVSKSNGSNALPSEPSCLVFLEKT